MLFAHISFCKLHRFTFVLTEIAANPPTIKTVGGLAALLGTTFTYPKAISKTCRNSNKDARLWESEIRYISVYVPRNVCI